MLRLAFLQTRIRKSAVDPHRVLWPRVVVCERDLPGRRRVVVAVAEPVVDLELDPGTREQVQGGRRLEGLPREQLSADQAWVRIEQPGELVRPGVLQRHIPPEPASDRAHQRVVEIVVGPVDRPRAEVAGLVGIRERGPVERPAAGVVEILLTQPACGARSGRGARAAAAASTSRSTRSIASAARAISEAIRRPFAHQCGTRHSRSPRRRGDAATTPPNPNNLDGGRSQDPIAQARPVGHARRGRPHDETLKSGAVVKTPAAPGRIPVRAMSTRMSTRPLPSGRCTRGPCSGRGRRPRIGRRLFADGRLRTGRCCRTPRTAAWPGRATSSPVFFIA